MHVKRHLSRLFGSFRRKGTDWTASSKTSTKNGQNKSLSEKVVAQLSISSKSKTCSRWELLGGVDGEAEHYDEEVNWLSSTTKGTAWEQDRDKSDNLLNGHQLEVPVLVEVCQAPTPTTTSDMDWSSPRVHSASRSAHNGCLEMRTTMEGILFDSYDDDFDCATSRRTEGNNFWNALPASAEDSICPRETFSRATLTKPNENREYEQGDDDMIFEKYTNNSSTEKKEKKTSRLYRYASFRFRSFNKKGKKMNTLARSSSLRSIEIQPEEEIKSIDGTSSNTSTTTTTRNTRVKLREQVKQQEVLEIVIKASDITSDNCTPTATTTQLQQKQQTTTSHNSGKGFKKQLSRKLSIKALKKSGNGMGKALKGGLVAVGRSMLNASSVMPHPYECPPNSSNYSSYWGNDYEDWSTYDDYHYQLEYNRKRYLNGSNNSLFFLKERNRPANSEYGYSARGESNIK